jgi:FKBP-type peptidyl-prolyl cis-trans isomerase FkpA
LQQKIPVCCLNKYDQVTFKTNILKNFILFSWICGVMVLFSGCVKGKTCSPTPPTAESSTIVSYAAANNMSVTPHSSGLYYQIVDPGSGGLATVNSKIVITYVGKLLDGTVFDRQDVPNSPAWSLAGLIEGWRIGIPLIQKGGHIRLLVPSALAYGCEPYKTLPGNSILFFDIQLVDIQ